MHTKGFLLLSGNKDSIKYILWEHKYEGSTCPLFFVNFPAAVCAWSWLAHSRLTGEVTWPQDASNYPVGHTLELIQVYSCVVSKLSLINTQLHNGGFWSISSLLFVGSFPTLCLALLSTQTGDVITWSHKRKVQRSGHKVHRSGQKVQRSGPASAQVSRYAATTINYNHHHHRPGLKQHDAAITATCITAQEFLTQVALIAASCCGSPSQWWSYINYIHCPVTGGWLLNTPKLAVDKCTFLPLYSTRKNADYLRR